MGFKLKCCHPEWFIGDPKKKFMTFSEVEAITTRLPSWTGGVDSGESPKVTRQRPGW